MKDKNKLLVILGPTATGKTDLALHLAKKIDGELVSCDSRQVYQGLDIGTGKLPRSGKWLASRSEELRRGIKKWEVGGINIWMYDVISPKRQYTVYDYVKNANRVIREIRQRGKLPIVVGGTGLYLKALLEGLPNLAIPVDKNLRKKLQKLSKEDLQERLKKLSPERWNSLNESDRQNPRRLVRAIELILNQKLKIKNKNDKLKIKNENFNFLKIGLTASREILYKKADKRVVERINQGMIGEAQYLHKRGLSFKRMKQLGLEYGVLADYLVGKIRKIKGDQRLVKIMQNKIHGFVKRQLTWFKKEKNVVWFDITSKNYPANVENLVTKWYYQS